MAFYDRHYWGYKPYKPDKNTTAHALDKLKKKGREVSPVIIAGKDISKSWWGIKWCQNLESYSDYYNRLERGRSYVRNGAVIDLKILSGRIEALVQGSDIDPYEVEISIKPLKNEIWKAVTAECAGKIHSLGELFEGRFPIELSTLFTAREKGIFPSPHEIDFECSCPDYAFMCKHVAAALYGVGARLDNDPALFFTLRNVKIGDVVSGAVNRKSEDMLKNANERSRRVIVDDGLDETFGIDIAGFESATAAAALPLKAELSTEKKAEIEDKIIFEKLPEMPELPEFSEPSKLLELPEQPKPPVVPLKNTANPAIKRAKRMAKAKFDEKKYEKSGAQKSRPAGDIKVLPDRIKALAADIENISNANQLDALAVNLAKLLKITVKKIELLKSLDELKAV